MRLITEEFIKAFYDHLCDEEKSENTKEKYIRDINAFRRWLCDRELNKAVVLEYKKHLSDIYAPSSINSMLSSINSFFEFHNWKECMVKTLKIQKKIFISKDKELTKAEYERLLRVAQRKNNKRLYYLMQTICSTGLRVSELKYINVNSVKAKKALIDCKGKMRVVLLPKELCERLKLYIKEEGITEGNVFVSRNGRPLDRSNIWKMLKVLCDEAEVSKEKVFPHNFRHLFARTYYSIKKDIVRLADILGHSSINTTRIYTMESCELHRRSIEKLGLLKCYI